MKTRKMVLLGLLTAIALTIFMLEAQIPAPVPIPGVKLGLANIVTVFTVFLLGPGEGCLVLAARIFLGRCLLAISAPFSIPQPAAAWRFWSPSCCGGC